MEPAHSKVAHRKIHPRDTSRSPHAIYLPFFVETPYGTEVFQEIGSSELPKELFGAAVPGSADYDICRELGAVLKNDAVLAEV